ncbi:DUF4129 domain-containing protein [Niveibacterium umoris]|uniref:Protein-glutamine gamma-glutamyltransferase-like C-terminal domain-containing protein n=1 Tax=Niveibacterium umoris TaxID=1193620 RepID=A0A840BMT9_9RHOO|nr:DUF4129 domain-containing protein [Niveibacterium umoris]MBB4014300.1 hypothetical protein [Niveibacterium umoris]
MRPEQLALTLRPRSGWEAIDLGVRLVQANARGVFASSFGVVLPVALLVIAIVGFALGAPDYANLLIWWLKPLYDRVILHRLSHAVFDERPSLRDTLRALPRLLRRSRLVPALLWRRFDPQRSVRLPIDQLEGLDTAQAKLRRQVISARIGGAGFGLMFCCVHFEYVLLFGLIALIESVLPEGVSLLEHVLPWLNTDSIGRIEPNPWLQAAMTLGYASMIAVVEPFYVAGGFSLYLKRRTDLEAWDLELLFRRLAAEGAHKVLAVLMAVACCVFAGVSGDARAEAPPSGDVRRNEAIAKAPAAIKDVLKSAEFGQPHKRSALRLRKEEEDKRDADAPWFRRWVEFWRGTGRWMAEALRVAGWIGIALAVAALLWQLARQLGLWRARRQPPPPPAEIAGLDIRPESLPDDVASAARALLAAGRHREALGLLYRAALSQLAHGERIPFDRGDTEGDCLMRVTRAGSASRAYFAQLTRQWQAVAYAHLVPSAADAEQLCAGWRRSFGGRA